MSFRRSWRQREVSRARRKAGPLRVVRVPWVVDVLYGVHSPRYALDIIPRAHNVTYDVYNPGYANSAKTKPGTRKTVGPRRIDRRVRVVDSPHF